jgi:hypothetical protein
LSDDNSTLTLLITEIFNHKTNCMLDISVGNTELTITIHRSANNYLYFRVRDSEENILLTSNEFRCILIV